jgi:hypothetical protein
VTSPSPRPCLFSSSLFFPARLRLKYFPFSEHHTSIFISFVLASSLVISAILLSRMECLFPRFRPLLWWMDSTFHDSGCIPRNRRNASEEDGFSFGGWRNSAIWIVNDLCCFWFWCAPSVVWRYGLLVVEWIRRLKPSSR